MSSGGRSGGLPGGSRAGRLAAGLVVLVALVARSAATEELSGVGFRAERGMRLLMERVAGLRLEPVV